MVREKYSLKLKNECVNNVAFFNQYRLILAQVLAEYFHVFNY